MNSRRENKLLSILTSKQVEGNKPGQAVEEYISKRFRNGDTRLHKAMRVHENHEEDIRDILDLGFPVNVTNDLGQSPLHYALKFKQCNCCWVSIVQLLVDRGADVRMCDQWHHGMIFYAFENENYAKRSAVIEFLVKKGASVRGRDRSGFNLLHIALLKNQALGVICVLVNNGVNVHAVNNYGVAALHVAARFKRKDVIKLLLQIQHIDIDVKDKEEGYTPLHRAISSAKSDAGTVQLLLEAGANVRLQTLKLEQPLHLAAYDCNLKIIKVLLKHGASVNVLDKYGCTPLYRAIKNCVELNKDAIKHSKDAIKALLDAGALVFYPVNAEKTPLHLAIDLSKSEKCVENLLQLQLLLKYAILERPAIKTERSCLTNQLYGVFFPFVQGCQKELKSVRVKFDSNLFLLSLPQFISRSRLQKDEDRRTKDILDLLVSDVCRVYKEVVEGLLTRKGMKDEIHKLMVYAERKMLNRKGTPKREILNCYSLCKLIKHLPDESLLNLLLVFHKLVKNGAPVVAYTSGNIERACKRARIKYVDVKLNKANGRRW